MGVSFFLQILEIGAVNATAFWATNLVQQRKLEGTVAIGCIAEARCIYVVAETKGELLIVEACAEDNCIHQFALIEFVRYARPSTQLECLMVATAVAQQKLE